MKTLILALGNPILSDDGVGWLVADRVLQRLGGAGAGVEVRKECAATLDLLGLFQPYDRLIIVDAIQLGQKPVGSVYRFSLEDFSSTIRYSSAHDINFATSFELGRQLGYRIPGDIRIYGIEVLDLLHFSETCTPPVLERLEAIAAEIADDLRYRAK